MTPDPPDLAAIQRRHEVDAAAIESPFADLRGVEVWHQWVKELQTDRGALLAALAQQGPRAPSNISVDCIGQGCKRAQYEDAAYEADKELEQERDTLRVQVQALQGRVVLVGEGDVYRPPTPDEWQMLFDKRSLQVENTSLRAQLEQVNTGHVMLGAMLEALQRAIVWRSQPPPPGAGKKG